MKRLKISALGLAGVLAVAALVLALGVPAGFVAKLAQDQVESATGYRLRIDGGIELAFQPSPIVTLNNISLVDVTGGSSTTSIAVQRVRVSFSLTSLLFGSPRVTELAIVKPAVNTVLTRRPERAMSAPVRWRNDVAGAAATSAFTIDRLTVEDGSIMMSNTRDRFESRTDRINVTGSVTADASWFDVRGYADDQPFHLQTSAKTPLTGSDRVGMPVEFSLEAPSMLKDKLTATADVRAGRSDLTMSGIAGRVGSSRFTGWASVDFSGKPLVKADIDVQRLDVALSPPASNGAVAPVSDATRASEPWSDQDFHLAGLNYLDADIKFSATELNVGAIRVAPVALRVTIADGILNAATRTGLYGGQLKAATTIDASSDNPHHVVRIEVTGVQALPLLSDAGGFGSLDGKLQAKIDIRAVGASDRAVMSSLSGSADLRIQDGQILGMNVPKMIRTWTSGVLTDGQESRTESTDLSDFSAAFRIEGGRATTSNLRLVGPLVRVSGSGTIDLGAQTLQLKLDPKLVASLQGQGGAADPPGFGVPVNVEGSWSDPRIYADTASLQSDPDGAYSKLKAVWQDLFGKAQGDGGALDTIMQGLGTIFGSTNDNRGNESGTNKGKDTRNQPPSVKQPDRQEHRRADRRYPA
jgi:AsmA protein